MSDDVIIRVTGDIEDVQAKFALVKDEFQTLSKSVADTAAAMNELGSGATQEFMAELTSLVGKANETKSSMDQLSSAVKGISANTEFWAGFNRDLGLVDRNIKAADESAKVFARDLAGLDSLVPKSGFAFVNNFDHDIKSAKASFEAFAEGGAIPKVTEGMNAFGLGTSRARYEVVVLAHEVMSGRFSRIPGSLMVLAESFGSISLAALGVTAAVAVTAGALGYLAVQAIGAAEATDRIKIGADLAANFNLSTKAIHDTVSTIDWMRDVSTADAREIVAGFASMRSMTEDELRAMSVASANFGLAQGKSAKEAAGQLVEILKAENLTIAELQDKFVGATRDEIAEFEQIQRTGNAHEIAAAKMGLVAGALDRERDSAVKANSAMFASFTNFMTYVGLMEAGLTTQEIENELIAENTKKWDEQTAALRKAAEEKKNMPLTNQERLLEGDKLSDKLDPQRVHMDALIHDIQELKKDLDVVKATETGAKLASDIAKYSGALKEAEGELANLQKARDKKADAPLTIAGTKGIEEARVQIAAIQADQDKSNSERLAAAEAVWNKLLEGARANSHQLNEIQIAASQSLRQFEIAVSNEQIQNARLHVSEINADEKRGAADRLAAITAVWAEVLASDKLTYQQRLEAERDFNNAVAAELRREKTIRDQITRDNISTELELRRIAIAAAKDGDEQLVQTDRLTEEQKLEHLKQFALDEEMISLQMLENQQKNFERESADYARLENQKRILHAQTAAEIQKLDEQIAANRVKLEKEDERQARQRISVVLGAEHELIDGIFNANESAKMILLRMTDRFLKKELEADADYVIQRLLLRQKGAIAEQGLEQGGWLVHLFTEQKKTTATAAGETERVAVKQAASAEGMATQVAAGSAEIMNDAFKAAAGAYSAVAGIPIVGPVLAPIAAGTAFAAVAAFDSLTALETGAWDIPKTMPAMLHPGEAVLPRTFAQDYRANIRDGRGSSEREALSGLSLGRTPDVHFQYSPTINAPERPTLPELVERDSSFMRNWIQSQIRSGALQIDMS